MKTKLLFLTFTVFLVMSCNQNPQKNAADKQAQNEKIAKVQDNKSNKNAIKAIKEESSAISHAVMAGANKAMASVPVPKFQNVTANAQVKKIGNDIVEFVNAKDNSKANHYQELLGKHIAHAKDLVSKNKISADDAMKIKNYVVSLAASVGLQVSAN